MKSQINITFTLVFSLCLFSHAAENGEEAEEPDPPVTEVVVPQNQPVTDPHAVHEGGPGQHGGGEVRPGSSLEDKFRRNIGVNPVASGEAFLEMVARRTPTELKGFIEKNYLRFFHLLPRLQEADPEKTYPRVLQELERNGIGIRPWPGMLPGDRLPDGGHDRHGSGGYDGRRGDSGEQPQDGANNTTAPPEQPMPPARPIDENPINRMMEIRSDLTTGRDPEKTAEKINSLSNDYPEDPSVQTGVSEFFNEMRNYEEALDHSNTAVKLDETNPDAYKIRALSRYSMNDVKGAMEDVKKAAELDPQDETARLLKAIINSKKAVSVNSLSSIQELKSALKDARADSPGVYIGAEAKGGTAKTSSHGQAVDYTKSKFYLKTAATKNQMQDYEGGLKYSTLAIDKNPDNLDAWLERANSHNFLGHYDEAIKDSSYVIEHDPANISALNMRAWSLYKKGELDKAAADSDRALEIKPDFADAMFNRSLVYEKQGRYEEMLTALEKASSLSPLYRSKFHDAVAQYANRAPNFAKNYSQPRPADRAGSERGKKNQYERFGTILIFTLTGGLLIGLGLLHVFSDKKNPTESRITHPDTLSPSVFYEGVATGKYKVVKKIGQGGMGIVYQAVDQTLNREVAIKKMNDEIKLNEREKQRFIEEARTVAMLHHPNIIEIYTIFEEGEDIYLVFEYIDGVPLDKKLSKEVRMPFYEAREIVNEIGKALSYAHGKNIIHRDMKLSNVMISRDGYVKVMDFGLAKIARETMARVSSTEVVGSPAYMAPEQDNGVSLKESDLYSLGVCLYEMLTGEIPFNGPDYHYQKEKKSFTPVSASVPGLPRGIDGMISKLLEPDPQSRYKSAEDFLEDLNKLA